MTKAKVSAGAQFAAVLIIDVLNPLFMISLGLFVSIGYILTLLMPVTIDIWQAVFWVSRSFHLSGFRLGFMPSGNRTYIPRVGRRGGWGCLSFPCWFWRLYSTQNFLCRACRYRRMRIYGLDTLISCFMVRRQLKTYSPPGIRPTTIGSIMRIWRRSPKLHHSIRSKLQKS